MQMNRTLRTLLILLVVVGGVALVGVRNVRAKIARCRIGAAQEMAESLCCMVEDYMRDHRNRLVCEGKRWRVVSNGPDGVPNTADDISFERTPK